MTKERKQSKNASVYTSSVHWLIDLQALYLHQPGPSRKSLNEDSDMEVDTTIIKGKGHYLLCTTYEEIIAV